MARGKVEQQVEALSRLRAAPRAEAHAGLERALRDRSNLVVAKAATVAGELGLAVLTADLLAAFDRLLEHSAERDPQCWGKNALAKALVALGHDDPAPYLRGVRHTQMESVWGGREDTAQTLRGTCLLALAACPMLRREEFLRCLVDALAENNVPVRLEAVRGLEQAGGEEAILVLRLKARLGDGEPRVMGQVFDALLRLEGEAAVPFLAGILETGEGETREEAALALGGSRFSCGIRTTEDNLGADARAGFPRRAAAGHWSLPSGPGNRISALAGEIRPRGRCRGRARSPGAASRFAGDRQARGTGRRRARLRLAGAFCALFWRASSTARFG